jgi:hypothetical protein
MAMHVYDGLYSASDDGFPLQILRESSFTLILRSARYMQLNLHWLVSSLARRSDAPPVFLNCPKRTHTKWLTRMHGSTQR